MAEVRGAPATTSKPTQPRHPRREPQPRVTRPRVTRLRGSDAERLRTSATDTDSEPVQQPRVDLGLVGQVREPPRRPGVGAGTSLDAEHAAWAPVGVGLAQGG